MAETSVLMWDVAGGQWTDVAGSFPVKCLFQMNAYAPQLQDVSKLYANGKAFAALITAGKVVV